MRPNFRQTDWQGRFAAEVAYLPFGPVQKGTPGNDHFLGGSSGDVYDMSQGGDDSLRLKGGADSVFFGAAFTGADRVHGGGGVDTVILDGDYTAGIDIQTDSLSRIERLALEGGSYVITGELASGLGQAKLYVDGSSLTADQHLNLNVVSSGDLLVYGSTGIDVLQATSINGSVTLRGDEGDDVIIGGAGWCILFGGAGADRIEMGGSQNVAFYGTLESTARSYDTIENFAASGGKIELYFDSDTSTPGFDFDFHFGKTADRAGDIVVKYDAAADETVVKVFTDHDTVADTVIHLTGDVPLTSADFTFG